MYSNVVRAAITPQRLTAYDSAARRKGMSQEDALVLYDWNAEIAAALLRPFHYFEVVVRNAIHQALTDTYVEEWPWDRRFTYSVPWRGRGYNPRGDLLSKAGFLPTTGKVIPELKFVFWEQMLTTRYDTAIWDTQARNVFPNASIGLDGPATARAVNSAIAKVRSIRNRVAHHEPIFTRDIIGTIDAIEEVTAFRAPEVGDWVSSGHKVREVFGQRPKWY